MKNTRLKIVLATLISIFNLFVCFVGTYAWFTAAKRNDASGMQVQIYTHELDMSYKVYKYIDDEKDIIDVTGKPDALKLQQYDSVITSRNINTSLLLDFNITGMSLGENIPVFINTHCNNNTTTDRVLSNIIRLQFANISTITSNNPADIYYQAISYFDNNSIPENKFRVENRKYLDVNYELSNYTEVNGVVRLFIRIDYSIDLINSFNFSISDMSTTSFANDLTMINCYTDED